MNLVILIVHFVCILDWSSANPAYPKSRTTLAPQPLPLPLPTLVAPPPRNYVTTNISPNNSAVVPPVWLVGAPRNPWLSAYPRGTRETVNNLGDFRGPAVANVAASAINPSQVVSIVSAHTVTLVVVAHQQAGANGVVNSDYSDIISPTDRYIVVPSSDVPVMTARVEPLSNNLSAYTKTLSSSESKVTSPYTGNMMTTQSIEPSVTKITSPSLIQLIERMMSSYALEMTTLSSTEPIEPTATKLTSTSTTMKLMQTIVMPSYADVTTTISSITEPTDHWETKMASSFTKILERVMSSYAAAMTTVPIKPSLTEMTQQVDRVTSSYPAVIKTVFSTEKIETSATKLTPSLIQLIERMMSSYAAAIATASATEPIEPTLTTITPVVPSYAYDELIEDVTSAPFDETTTFSPTEENTYSVIKFTPYLTQPTTVAPLPSTEPNSPVKSNSNFLGISVDTVSNVVNLNRAVVSIPAVHLPVASSAVFNPETFFDNQHTVVNSKSFSRAGFTRSMNDSSDPCSGFSCGSNAQCLTRSIRIVCQCRSGYEGDPYTGCRRSECVENAECPSNKVCQHFRCINPCPMSCGVGAECNVRNNHVTVCQCPRGFIGDPFVSCTPSASSNVVSRQNSSDFCNPTPCGANTKCQVENSRAVCSCLDGWMGNPIQGCRRECESDSECDANRACTNFRCQDPCGSCGTFADCNIRNHRAICSCPANFLGDPFTRCFSECTQHEECPNSQACFNLKCVNPCTDACGIEAECRVENHQAICSCPKEYTGHPFDRCRPFDKSDLCNPNPCGVEADCKPGSDRNGSDRPVCFCPVGFLGDPLVSCSRGQCIEHADCATNQACSGYQCVDPCTSTTSRSVCGVGARCDARNHGAVCSCPVGTRRRPINRVSRII